jgi:histidine triad (HIT) family protein|tara:strand:- start:298 stop:642 length:345 start_codon:yes stop_codon:yes gene_type:complete
MMDCLFCKIVRGDIPTDFLYEDENIIAFRDINPQAPTHILIVPKEHIATLNDVEQNHGELLGGMQIAASQLAREEGISDRGYRTVFNCNREAGQTVFHIHLHLLGGRRMSWPPG